jgi:outer membrane protein TolC
MRRLFFFPLVGLLAAGSRAVQAQSGTPLDELVGVGLKRNLSAQQARAVADGAAIGVRAATGALLPSATVNARYTELRGSTLNLGTLINPAYATLNQLTNTNNFPTNINLRLPLTQETSVRVQQPIFVPAAWAGVRIAGAVRDVQAAARDGELRGLAAQIRIAYLNVVRARAAVDLYTNGVTLLDEAVRVREKLAAAGSATSEAVYRVRAERSGVIQQRDEARQTADAAAQAFNQLLDRPLDTPVPVLSDAELGIATPAPLDTVLATALAKRDELRQLDAATSVAKGQRDVARAAFLPTLAVALDYGVQGQYYRFKPGADYSSLSAVFSWNLFNGTADAARTEQATIDAQRLGLKHTEAQRLIALEVRVAWDAARVAEQGLTTATERLESARRSYELTRRRHEEGAASVVELLDARTAYTNAGINLALTRTAWQQRCIELERAAATYPRTL